jgi:hypothetical protein
MGFWTLSHHPVFEGTRRFGNWICFLPQVKGGKKTPTQLGPLERPNLNHWTISQERKKKGRREIRNRKKIKCKTHGSHG